MDDATFAPLEDAELASWLTRSQQGYVADRMAAGDTLAEATANATSSLDRLFPGGTPAPGQLVGRVICDGEPVGELWVGPAGNDSQRWWVWSVAVDEARRGRGYGRKAMVLAETLARRHGATSLGLNVFGRNHVARNLYTSLGYDESAVQMRKSLSAPEPG
jgi:ribosomal protein S18 acetylase RimI-like enzyme